VEGGEKKSPLPILVIGKGNDATRGSGKEEKRKRTTPSFLFLLPILGRWGKKMGEGKKKGKI